MRYYDNEEYGWMAKKLNLSVWGTFQIDYNSCISVDTVYFGI
jgi:hypothetical protein